MPNEARRSKELTLTLTRKHPYQFRGNLVIIPLKYFRKDELGIDVGTLDVLEQKTRLNLVSLGKTSVSRTYCIRKISYVRKHVCLLFDDQF